MTAADNTGRPRARSALTPPPAAASARAALPQALLAWAEQAPLALALTAADSRILWVNPAFEALTGFAPAQSLGAALIALLGAPLAPAWPLSEGAPVRRTLHARDGRALPCDVHCARVAPGQWMLTLTDRRGEDALQAQLERVAGLLEFVQDSVRIGTYERDIRTLDGRWDAHMFRFYGLDPAQGIPTLDAAIGASVAQDHLYEAFTRSFSQPGRHTHRFRLHAADGSVRRVQSHWEVQASPDGTPARVIGLVMDDTDTFAHASTLDRANAQLQLAVDLADLAIWRHDLVTQRVHYNARAYQVLDIPPREEGLTLEEVRSFIHEDDLAEVTACYHRALQSHGPEDMQARYRRHDGSWRHVLTRRVTQRDGHGRPIAFNGVALDITEQVERTRRASDLARQLEDVAADAGIGIWRFRRDGSGSEWNLQMYELSGVDPHLPPLDLDAWVDHCVHPDDRERVRTEARQWMRSSAGSKEVAHRLLGPDGQVRHVVNRGRAEPAGSPYVFAGVTIDVTERELALAALNDALERTALATRAAGIGVWDWDLDSDTSHWDAQMFQLRGLAPRDTAPPFAEMTTFLHPDDREFVNEQVRLGASENRASYYEFRIVRPDGAVRWIASRSMPVHFVAGQARQRLGVNWDVTEARAAEAARQERALALRESQAKSELLARMSHELRTPMNAVLGFTHLLLADDPDPASTRHIRLEHIRDAGEHLLTLINDVLDLARPDGAERSVTLQPVALAELVAQTLPMVERLAEQHGVRLDAHAAPLQVQADPTRLKQVLVNLLTNAIKYNRAGGTVQVDARREGAHVLLRVRDDGIGMTPGQITQAFEPFNRAGVDHEGVEGTGIGLTIVRALVERMGGQVEVRSEPGVGSVFEVRLAALDAAGGPEAAVAEVPRRLLYIEDNPVNVLIVSELVRRRGDIAFESAPDGLGGVAMAARLRPGLVLVDMQLPDISGLDVLARLRADPATAGLTCIALSANAMPEDIQQALDRGFDGYWTKPLDFTTFRLALDRVFGVPLPR